MNPASLVGCETVHGSKGCSSLISALIVVFTVSWSTAPSYTVGCSMPIGNWKRGLRKSALGAFGRFVHQLAQGQDARPVQSSRVARSRGAETTFGEDISDLEKLRDVLHGLAAEVSRALVRLERPARTITLKVRYASFDTVTRSKTLVTPIWAGDAIEEVAGALLHRTDAGTRPVRLVGVSASNLVESEVSAQLELPLEAEMETFGSSNATFAGIG